MTSPRLSTPIGAPPKGSLRDDRRFLLVNLSLGHAMAHCFSQSFTVVLPYIQNYMGFGDLQYGLLLASRQLSQGAINIPLGFMIDALRRYWGLIFTGCMVGIALAFALAGSSPNYWVLVLAAAFVAFPGSVWHLPAFALLSQRFPEKRGFALSTHSAGGNVGGTVGPLVAGLLLWLLISQEGGGEWRYVLFIFVAPALLMVLPIFWTLHNVGSSTEGIPQATPLRQRISDASRLIRRPAILAIMAVLLLRGLGFNALNNWAPKYLEDGANQPAFWVGVDMALYIGLGIIFGPVLGLISDKVGRKPVIIPGLLISAGLAVLVVMAGSNALYLALLFAAMGPFSHTLSQLLQASVLDITGRGTEATAMGLVMGIQGLVLAGSPLGVGLMIDHLGIHTLFYYAAIIFAVATAVLIVVPISRPAELGPTEGARR